MIINSLAFSSKSLSVSKSFICKSKDLIVKVFFYKFNFSPRWEEAGRRKSDSFVLYQSFVV